MSARRLDRDDVLAAVGLPRTPTGRHAMHGVTELEQIGDDRDPVTQMVVWHELSHADLNRHTVYGRMLQTVARAVLRNPDAAGRARLIALVEAARRVHEVYATASGVWMAAHDPERLLAGYPGYRAYLHDAETLHAGFEAGSVAAFAIVDGIATAAMNAPIAARPDDEAALAAFSAGEIAPGDTPDERFALLLRCAPPAPTLFDADPAWRESLFDPRRLPWETERLPGLAKAGAELVVRWAGEQLARVAGAATVPSGGHVTAAERTEIEARRDPGQTTRQAFAAHRVVLRDARPRLTARVFDGPPPDWPDEPVPILCCRPTELLLEQYELDEASREAIVGASDGGCALGVRWSVGAPRGSALRLELIEDLQGLARLERLLDASARQAIVSISLSVAARDGWEGRWVGAIAEMAYVTFLLDVDPFLATDLLRGRGAHDPGTWADRFTVTRDASDGADVPGACLRFLPAVEGLPTPHGGFHRNGFALVAITSSAGADELCAQWERPDGFGAEIDRHFGTVWPPFVRLLASLVEEEPWFDFLQRP